MESPTGDWNNEWQQVTGPGSIIIGAVQNPKLLPIQGKTIEDSAFTSVAMFTMAEPDVALALRQPWVSICNDSQGTAPGGLLGKEHPHPRAYGTFPHVLRKYVREDKTLTLEDAIRTLSALSP